MEQQGDVEAQNGGLLPSVLGVGTGENTPPTFPKRAPFCQSPPVASRKWRIWAAMFPKCVGVFKVLGSCLRDVGKGFPRLDGAHFLDDFLRECFWDMPDVDNYSRDVTCPFSCSFGHGIYMSISGVEKNQYSHVYPPPYVSRNVMTP